VTIVDSLRGDERVALDDVVAMCDELIARARALVATGARPLDAVAEVLLTSDPRAVAGVAMVSILAALDTHHTDRRSTAALN
jgi:predicted metal-dependent enzyme (double-stranded beta helix superfamily)